MDSRNAVPDAPEFVALGLGGTNMMALLWTVAMGHRAAGVEMRGDPFLGVHWNIREDFYHQLGLIDQMMLDRYGEARLPRRGDGRVFRLAECFYSPQTASGDIVADEIIDGYDTEQHIVGTIQNIEFIDDRWRDGLPNRVITLVDPPTPPDRPDPRKIRTSMVEILDGPSMFQAEAASIQKLLRRYLELIERQDVESGRPPRVRLFTHHRVVTADGDGFVPAPDGRLGIRIEALREFDFKGQFVRVREPGSMPIDLGVPDLFMIAQGFSSTDAKRLGYEQRDVTVDHGDGRGPVVAQADFLAGLLDVLVGGRLRRRISSEFDQDGKEYWVRQIAVGHENDPEVGWVLVQVPDFKAFDPVDAGLVPPGTDPNSPEYFAAYQQLIYDYYMEQCADILEVPTHELTKVQMIYGPTLFSLVERVGDDPLIAANGVVAGDSFGNGHFLTSGGAMTGMIGHSARVLEYWRARDAGVAPVVALRRLADSIREDTHAWLRVSAKEYSQAIPINFGAERIERIRRESGIDANARANVIDAARRHRHALIPLDPSNWRRLFVHNGRVLSALPELAAAHPRQRAPQGAPGGAPSQPLHSLPPALATSKRTPDEDLREGDRTLLRPRRIPSQASGMGEQTLQQAGRVDATRAQGKDLRDGNRTVLMPWPADAGGSTDTMVVGGDRTLQRSWAEHERRALGFGQSRVIGPLAPEGARVYLCLDIEQGDRGEQGRRRIAITEDDVVVGRGSAEHGATPNLPKIDLAPFDRLGSVSRRHARIRREGAVFYIEDLESRNKTRLGTATLTPHRAEPLHDGDVVAFGSVEATIHLLGGGELPTPWSRA